MGGREYLGCIAVLAVLSPLSGVGFLAVAGAVLSLFAVPIVLLVVGGIAFGAWVVRESRRS